MPRAGRSTGRRGPRRAAAALELALVLPILMVIVLGAIDFGRFAHDYVGVTNSARAGASYAVINRYMATDSAAVTAWQDQIRERARDEMFAGDDPRRDLLTVESDVHVDKRDTYGVRRVRVWTTYPFRTAVPWPGVPRSITLKGAVEMRAIR